MRANDPTLPPRYTIRRRGGQTWCEACDLHPNQPVLILWFTAVAAQQRGLTHCDQCGQPVVPPADAPEE